MVTADVVLHEPGRNLPVATGGEPFRNFRTPPAATRLPGTGLDRTREGYVEIIEMGVLTARLGHRRDPRLPRAPRPTAPCVQGAALTPSSIEAPSGGLSAPAR